MLLMSPNQFESEEKVVLALKELSGTENFDLVLSYMEREKNNIAFDSCKCQDERQALKKQGAVLVLDELITRAREAREIFNKLKERKLKK